MTYIKKRIVLLLGAFMILSCTGCAGMTKEEMKEEADAFMQEGEAMSQKLISEASEMNSSSL